MISSLAVTYLYAALIPFSKQKKEYFAKRNKTTNCLAFNSPLSIVIEKRRQKERERKSNSNRPAQQQQRINQERRRSRSKSSTAATLLLVKKKTTKSIDAADATIVYDSEGPVAFMA